MAVEFGNKEVIYNLLKKVNNLANKGVDGEKEVAASKLKQLLDKYNINYEDFLNEIDSSREKYFKVEDWGNSKDMMIQCIKDTLPSAKILGSKKNKKLLCYVTNEQYIEILDKYNHYWENYKKEEQGLFIAFVVKNSIGISTDKNDRGELTDEQRENIKMAVNHFGSINEDKYSKKLKRIK